MAEIRRDRGQLILVAGLVLAVLFVSLALLVNTAIYTENTATRGNAPGASALEYQGAAVTTVGGLIDAQNDDEDANARDVIDDGISSTGERLDDQFARRGATKELGINETTDGFLIVQRDSGNFTNRDGDTDYTHVDDVQATRNFVFEIDQASTSSNPDFHAVLNDTNSGTNESRYYIYEDGGNITVRLEIEDTGGVEQMECSIQHNAENVTVDLTEAELESNQETVLCRDFEWPEEYDAIEYRNADDGFGTYRFTVDADESNLVIDTLDDLLGLGLTDPDGPYAIKAVYDVTLDIRYDSPAVSYETTVRVAPGEPDA